MEIIKMQKWPEKCWEQKVLKGSQPYQTFKHARKPPKLTHYGAGAQTVKQPSGIEYKAQK